MLEFLGCGFADVDDLDGKMELFAGERMVRIDGYLVVRDTDDGYDLSAFFTVGFELHSDLDLGICSEFALVDLEYEALVALAVAFGRRNDAIDLIAGPFALEVFFEPLDDIVVAVEIDERFAVRGRVDEQPLRVFEIVID